ncbi:MAG: hypothetical protein QW802_03875 [Candidatus Altiarchaeota archaeon]
MKRKFLVLALVITLATLLVVSEQIYAVFSGIVKINGQNAPTNSKVIACIGNEKKGEAQTYQGLDGNTWYAIQVFNGTTNDKVTFRVNGFLANEIGTYVIGIMQPLNLTVNQASYTLQLQEGWNLISVPLELRYDGCVDVL